MAFVVCATWISKPGESDAVRAILEVVAPLSRQEPDTVFYQAHTSPDNPDLFFIYEQYTSREGFERHRRAPHFQEHVIGNAVGRLASREIVTYETLDA